VHLHHAIVTSRCFAVVASLAEALLLSLLLGGCLAADSQANGLILCHRVVPDIPFSLGASVDALPPWLYLGPLLIFVDNHIHNVLGCFFSSRFVRLGGSSFLFVCFSTYPVVCHLLGAFVTWRYDGSRSYVIVILFRSSQ